jgi:hypothetical protein
LRYLRGQMSGPRQARDHGIKRGREQVEGEPAAADLIEQAKHAASLAYASLCPIRKGNQIIAWKYISVKALAKLLGANVTEAMKIAGIDNTANMYYYYIK